MRETDEQIAKRVGVTVEDVQAARVRVAAVKAARAARRLERV